MSEDIVIRNITFPPIPDNISDEMKQYLNELENTLIELLKGSLLLENAFEDGIIGN